MTKMYKIIDQKIFGHAKINISFKKYIFIFYSLS